jgi:hypothetical protein
MVRLAALGLVDFKLPVTGIELDYWKLQPGHERFMAEDVFFEHLGLTGRWLPAVNSDSGPVSISDQIFLGSPPKTPCGILSDFA